ncbi:phage tail protein [Paenibacillus thalictri]|uniref:Phage tail protein n=1 Tax=Paenibacillus thalictri TaxID=2527873 RepID=A0A4Q9DUS6_9BACL|nr:phage tail protein [Paenibacillus thalictri]TBL80767.1 hypothetical protein EYB31_05960 [Paenibacillus thalictri]
MSDRRFFSFRRPPDWRRGQAHQLVSAQHGLSIVKHQLYRYARTFQLANPLLKLPLRDAVAEPSGRWLLLDAVGTIWHAELSSGHMEALLTSGGAAMGPLTRLAVTADSVVIMDPEAAEPLQAIVSDQAQLKWTAAAWRDTPFRGHAIAATPGGDTVILAELADEDRLHLLWFNHAGMAARKLALPLDKTAGPRTADDRFELSFGENGHGWLIDREAQLVAAIDAESGDAAIVPRSEALPGQLLAVCDAGSGTAWLLIRNPQAVIEYELLRVRRDGQLVERGVTSNRSGTRLISRSHSLELWDPSKTGIHMLKPALETAVWKPFGRRLGVWFSDSLDSGAPGTEWHKIVMEARREHDTQINVRFLAADEPEFIIGGKKLNLDSYLADTEVAPETKLTALASVWSEPLRDPYDALLFRARGRYIWVYLELIGSEAHTPVIHSLEVHFPRRSYLEYLPSIYQQDERSKDFLDRYLSLFQTMLEETDDKIDQAARAFDADGATGVSLRWLFSWLGIQAEANWPEEKLRALLKQAPTLYRLRGTKYAMETVISIYTGEKPIILEYEQVKPLKENPELGEVAERLYAAEPGVFNVLVKPEHAETDMQRIMLQQLIESFKPAFAVGKLVILQPWVFMDLHSYLGLNTVLSEPTLLTLDGRSSMPHHTITIDVGQDSRINEHTRLGIDSRLE